MSSFHRSSLIPERASFIALVLLLLSACSSRPTAVPSSFTEANQPAPIYPDYRDVTIPPNIAPLNFMVQDSLADAYVAQLGDLVCGATADGKMDIDTTAWRTLLTQYRGKTLTVNVYGRRSGSWVHYRPHTLEVAQEPIDSFLSYRLIEPGYELYRQLGLYQRNLTNFHQAVIYENNRSFEDQENHCVNCHNYQNYNTERMVFHVRGNHGGTIVTQGREARKIAIKHDSILAAGVYPTWHPTLPLIVFSSNKTGQVFHMQHSEKIEVIDLASDLVLYDPETNTVSNILRGTDHLETFPCWAPDGRRLYYCSAKAPGHVLDDEAKNLIIQYESLDYDIYSMPFDPETRTFGEPQLEVNASANGLSTSVPRISPDGRYLLFTLGDYGQFHIWHRNSDLWVKDLTKGPDATKTLPDASPALYPLSAANGPDADSYHSWSSNGRWIVFASRRDDGDFSRPYIAYFDQQGQAHRAFLLPQRDPEQNLLLLKSYNVPELTRTAVRVSIEKLNHIVSRTEAEVANYQ